MKPTFLPLLLTGCLMEVDLRDPPTDRQPPSNDLVDEDDDGVSVEEGDCDDTDPDAGPGAWGFAERCDGIDNDCDKIVDEAVCDRMETFPQVLRLDTLLVIDTSMSMTPYVQRAAEGAGDLVEQLVGPAFDTHIGVVTMQDPDALGELVRVEGVGQYLVGNDPKLTLDAARLWLTRAMTDNPTVTGAQPLGRGAVSAALPRFPAEDWNVGFLRGDARLQLVFMSDREDATVSPTQARFLEDLDELKGPNVTIHAITQIDELACDGSESRDTMGASYLNLADSTGGTSLSVCEADYGPYFSAIGQIAATEGLNDEFTLTNPAQSGSVRVSVRLPGVDDPVELPSDEIFLGGGGRTVLLKTQPLPPAGSTIFVDYLEQY